jgi:transcriptional regulator with XRE-family HTH domain
MVDVLRERAALLELTQRDVAERAGLSQPRVSRVFAHGVALTFEVTLRMCGALDVTLEDAYHEARRRALA